MTSYCQNGWPVLLPGSHLLHTWTIPAQVHDVRVTFRQGSAGWILAHMFLTLDKMVEPLTGPIVDDWGHAVRPIRGKSSGYSNHAGGTAGDYNATQHPLGRVHTFSPAQEKTIRRRLQMYDGCLGWGGNYSGRKDEMHFEIVKPMSDCEKVARHLMDKYPNIIEANPGQRAVILS